MYDWPRIAARYQWNYGFFVTGCTRLWATTTRNILTLGGSGAINKQINKWMKQRMIVYFGTCIYMYIIMYIYLYKDVNKDFTGTMVLFTQVPVHMVWNSQRLIISQSFLDAAHYHAAHYHFHDNTYTCLTGNRRLNVFISCKLSKHSQILISWLHRLTPKHPLCEHVFFTADVFLNQLSEWH